MVPHQGAPEQGVVGLDDVEALSLRVKEVLRKCTAKLNNSRAGIQDLATKRDGFALHLREAEEDFGRMSHDWRSIEDELKHVREMMISSGNLSPRARSKLLDSMVRDPYARGANGEALLKDVRAGHSATSPGGYRSLKSGFGHSPPSEDVSTEVVSTAAATLESWSQEHSRAYLQAPPPEQVQTNTIAAILSAAGRASHADDILEASRAGGGSLSHNSPSGHRSTPLQEAASPYSQLEESPNGDGRREHEQIRAPSTEQRGGTRERANIVNGDGRREHEQMRASSTEQRRAERQRAQIPLPHLPSEGAPVLGDALEEAPFPHRPARRHQTQPATASSGPALGRRARAMVPGSFADSRASDRRL